ncbi:MAG: FAD-dependent oxidoreductase [Polaromonas sp.]|nr:FAD-dependent oxidoreductase [Polaromonas sp.]
MLTVAATPQETLTVDVLIAGGGPCGLMLANELGQRGIRCLMVDPKPGTAFNPQANATQARTMEHFRRLGFAHEIRAEGLPPDHPSDIAYFTRFTAHELARLRLPTAAQAVASVKGLSGSWSAAELPHRVSQKYVEVVLRRHAGKWPACDIRYGWALDGFEDRSDGDHPIQATIRCVSTGESWPVQARYLVGADGPRSPVRQALGIGWGGSSGVKRQFMGGTMFAAYVRAPAFYTAMPHDRAWMYVAVNAQRRGFIATVDGCGEFAFHAAVQDGEDAESWTAADARRIFAEVMGCEIPMEVLSVGTWLAGHALVAQRFQQGHVFIAGDAAHLFTPTGGLGYNTAVEDAVNLGWKLASVIRAQAPPELLASYELERKPLAERNTAYARQFADSVGLLEATPQLDDDSLAGAAERLRVGQYLDQHVRLEFNIPGVTFGGRYDASPLIVHDGTLAPPDAANSYTPTASPGGRPPHAWLADGRSLFDTFHTEWTLLQLGVVGAASDVQAFIDAASALTIDLKVVAHSAPELHALYEAPLALIRPDQIIAWRGHDALDAAAVLAQASGRGVPGQSRSAAA